MRSCHLVRPNSFSKISLDLLPQLQRQKQIPQIYPASCKIGRGLVSPWPLVRPLTTMYFQFCQDTRTLPSRSFVCTTAETSPSAVFKNFWREETNVGQKQLHRPALQMNRWEASPSRVIVHFHLRRTRNGSERVCMPNQCMFTGGAWIQRTLKTYRHFLQDNK